MKMVIKLGGSLLAETAHWEPLLSQLVALQKAGHQCLLVHGGGKALTSFLQERGVESRFVQGLRITDAQTRDAALMVLGGFLNRRLASQIQTLGGSAIGMCGDAGSVTAHKSPPEAHGGVDLGYVGEVADVDGELLGRLQALGLIVVMASLAPDRSGEFYNINADVLASACAAATKADRLVYLTDVPGVLDDAGQRIPVLTRSEIGGLIDRAVISGGMLPKLRSCLAALERGVSSVRIIPGSERGSLLAALESGAKSMGTEIR